MIDLENVEFNETSAKLVEILCRKTQNPNPLFFNVLVAYYLCKVASMMRVNIDTHDRGKIPVNLYAINLAPSGQGKGHSTNIVEDFVINQFKDNFLEHTFPKLASRNLAKLAIKRATKKQTDEAEELDKTEKEFVAAGELAFSFDSGTPAAVKQMRHKLLMANAGSMNLEIDEIGSNLMGNIEVMNVFLELYDVGKVKQKLTKNTNENVRGEEIWGRTPTNLMLFGTPSKLLNGGKVEEELYAMLETGFARRCLFGFSKVSALGKRLTPEERYARLTDSTSDDFLGELSYKLGRLADIINFGKTLIMSKAVSILCITYQDQCEVIAESLGDHEEIKRAELTHRYFKALKLAGAYAFIEGSHEITEKHLLSSIKLVEASGEAFNALLTRDRNYVKLAKYIASIGREVTHVDLTEDLPFYKGSEAAKREMMTLATAYGYRNNIIIKKIFNDGIEFLKGESLQETDLNKLTISYSNHVAYNYTSFTDKSKGKVKFDDLHTLTQEPDLHWTNHALIDGSDNKGHRNEENCISGFNLVVIDVDEGVSLSTARLLLQDYKALFYTTKRHTSDVNRFRIIFPMNYTLKMDALEYKEFMNNVYEWLPFKVDAETNQRSRKWQTHSGQHWYNEGQLLDALPFIPKTTKNEERKKTIDSQQSLNNVERWFIHNTGTGNRSNQLIKYALMLVDAGQSLDSVCNNVTALNDKLPDKMSETEIMSTIMVTASKALFKRDAAK